MASQSVVRGPAGNNECRVYVGNLPPDIREKDIEDMFYKFGSIADIDLKNKRPPSHSSGSERERFGTPFAFVEFYDRRDADDAVLARDGYNYDGYRIRVEFPRGTKGFKGSRPRGPPPRRSSYRVIVSGLPSTGSWQDLKDHMREAGDVCYADVYRDGTGVVEFLRPEDMKYAVKQLDDTKFRSHEGDVSYIRVKVDPTSGAGGSGGGRSRSRSPSPYQRGSGGAYRSRSRSRSPTWAGSSGRRRRSRSRSFSRSRSRSSRSGTRSRSRSRS